MEIEKPPLFVSLIFPCRNEEASIDRVLPKAITLKSSLLREGLVQEMEILVIDDASHDASLKHLQKYQQEESSGLKVLSSKVLMGYGSALKKGIRESKGDWIAFCDLDDTCEPSDLRVLLKKASSSRSVFPVVWGNRLHRQSSMPWIRRLGNRLYQLIFLILSFRLIPDPCSGWRLFRKSDFLPQINEFPNDLSFSLAFTAYCVRSKIKFSAVDVSYRQRMGKSKLIFFKDGFIFLFTLIHFLLFKRFKN